MYLNIRSIKKNIDLLSSLISAEDLDAVLITESWLNPSTANSLIANATMLEVSARLDRSDTIGGIGGGLIVLSKPSINVRVLDSCDFGQAQTLTVSLGNEVFCLVYRSPSSSFETDQQLANWILLSGEKKLILGDFNLPRVDWARGHAPPRNQAIYHSLQQTGYQQLVNTATHVSGNILDLVLASDSCKLNLTVHPELRLSDHYPILLDLQCSTYSHHSCSTFYDYSKADFKGFETYLAGFNWTSLLQGLSTVRAWSVLKEVLQCGLIQFVPVKIRGQSCRRQPPWLSKDLLHKIRKKRRLYKKSSPEFTLFSKELTKEIRNAKRNYEINLSESLKTHPRKFYSYLNSKKGKQIVGPLIKNGHEINQGMDTANVFNQYFSSVFTKDNGLTAAPPSNRQNSKMPLIFVTPSKVLEKIAVLKTDSASGPDKISPVILKSLSSHLCYPLSVIYNLSLQESCVPVDWKNALVVPIHKGGTRSDPASYRPISLTSQLSKILESIIADAVCDYYTLTNFLNLQQHGFRRLHSCQSNLLMFWSKVEKIIESGNSVDVVLLDFAKAFDKVSHVKLLEKLKLSGVNNQVVNWVSAWLFDRNQSVILDGIESEPVLVVSGVPQGSVLGPLLFLVYINDISAELDPDIFLSLFADDTKLLSEVSSPGDMLRLQNALNKLQSWAEKWQMSFNTKKCQILHLGPNNPQYKYFLNGDEIKPCSVARDLGIYLQDNLKQGAHVQQVIRKINCSVAQVKVCFTLRNDKIAKTLYNCFVLPHLSYCSTVWTPQTQDLLQQLQVAQNRFLRLFSKSASLLRHRLKILSVTQQLVFNDLVHAFKLLRDGSLHNPGLNFVPPNRSRRIAQIDTISLPSSSAKFRGFLSRVPKLWNSLPQEIRTCRILNSFKSLLRSHLLEKE